MTAHHEISPSSVADPAPDPAPPSATLLLEVSDAVEDPAWDGFVERVPGGSHVQTSIWGQLKATEGWTPVRVVVKNGTGIVAGAQLLVRRLPLRNAVAYVPKGPIFAPFDRTAAQLLLKGLRDVASRHGVRHLSVQPADNGEEVVPLLTAAGYRPSDTSVAPVATVQIDLSREDDEILAAMRKNHRRYVRHGLREGVVGRLGTEDDLEDFYRLVVATSQRQGFTPHPFEHFVKLWDLFHHRGQLQLFLAEYRGQPVSGQLALAFGDIVTAKNSGWSGEHADLGPNHVMEWTTIQWAKRNGYRCYDLEGIDVRAAALRLAGEPLSDKLRSSHSFYKLGFGGEVVMFPKAHVLIPNPLLRWGFWSVYPRLSQTRTLKKSVNRLRSTSGSQP